MRFALTERTIQDISRRKPVRKVWVWLLAALVAVAAFAGWLMGRSRPKVIKVPDPRPVAKAELKALEERTKREMVEIDRRTEKEIRHVEKQAEKEIRRLADNPDELDARLDAFFGRSRGSG